MGRGEREFGMDSHTLRYLKWLSNKDLLNSTGNPAQCYVAAWMGGEFGGKRIHMYLSLSPLLFTWNHHNIVNWLYLNTKYCSWVLKVIILKWFAVPFSSGPHFVRTLHHDLSILGGPTWHGSKFHWVKQGWAKDGVKAKKNTQLWMWMVWKQGPMLLKSNIA